MERPFIVGRENDCHFPLTAGDEGEGLCHRSGNTEVVTISNR